MTCNATDLIELIRHHLVFVETDDGRVTQNLRRLVAEID
jgi:hypothetical protein